MDGYIGTFPAVARRFQHITRTGLLWRHRSKAATCEDDRPPQIEVDYYVDSWSGGRSVNRVALALASDGALVARFDLYSCWICLFRNKTLRYARFPPATDSPAETPQGPAR
jgi:hypothetical protein